MYTYISQYDHLLKLVLISQKYKVSGKNSPLKALCKVLCLNRGITMQSFSNAFELLTDDVKEVENFTMRSNMMNAIVDLIKSKDWTQKEAAEHLGVSQPRISNLKNGKIDKFSVDMLMGMLAKLGFTFEFNYTQSKADVNLSMTVSAA
jgi:predicted XRE-type DNA-binding protein